MYDDSIILEIGIVRRVHLYAYQQQKPLKTRRLHVVPDGANVLPHIKKKRNPIVEFFRFFVVTAFLLSFAWFVLPMAFNRLIKNVFFPLSVPVNTEEQYNMASVKYLKPLENGKFSIVKPDAVDIYSFAFPVTNYLSNDLFLNRLLLTPTIQKTHSEVTTMYHTSEMKGLKSQLISLMRQYPMIKPAIYVWEYENGKFVDINSDKMYPAASIIKIPVLVRLFKSIEANQFTIYDDMPLTEYYRSSGSGYLQFKQSGLRFTMDQLAKTMIQDSDNTSTNMIMSKLGGMNDINIGLRDWGISKTYVRTWLPDLNGTNKTTAADIAKILYNLDNPGFLNINSREYIIDYMSHVKNNRLIAAGLGDGAMFIHKTGDIGSMLGDAGIVYAQNGKKYIIVILANRPHNAPQGKEFIVKASSLIYKAIVGD